MGQDTGPATRTPNPPVHGNNKYAGVTCKWDEEPCDRPAKSAGFCMSHYGKDRRRRGIKPPSHNPDAFRARRIKHRYGITIEQYEQMVEDQQGLCAVCGHPPTNNNTRAHWDGKLCIDHDHETGEVRGLLCNDCNLAVGYGKTPETLRAAAEYLQRRTGHGIAGHPLRE